MIKTAGGDSRKSLSKSFEQFFEEIGVHKGKFKWGPDYFPTAERVYEE